MVMSDFKRQALRDMNRRFFMVALVISSLFAAMYYALAFIEEMFDKKLAESVAAGDIESVSLVAADNAISFIGTIQAAVISGWVLVMILMIFKWLFRQYIART